MRRKRITSAEILKWYDSSHYFDFFTFQVDFAVDHASCSRVHALLMYHTVLNRFALVDMGSSKLLDNFTWNIILYLF